MSDAGPPLIRIRGLAKSYHRGEQDIAVLLGIDLDVAAGEFVALMGPSGSGKSTLLNLIAGIDQPSAGTIQIGGVDIATLGEGELADWRAAHVGFIFQFYNLIPVLSAFENVELPLLLHAELTPAARRERVEQALGDVALLDFRRHWPDKLSGGQRQRVAVARALANRPKLVLADEPTANLDSETAAHLIDLMVELNQKRKVTFLFSTHDEKLMVRVPRIVRIRDGRTVDGVA